VPKCITNDQIKRNVRLKSEIVNRDTELVARIINAVFGKRVMATVREGKNYAKICVPTKKLVGEKYETMKKRVIRYQFENIKYSRDESIEFEELCKYYKMYAKKYVAAVEQSQRCLIKDENCLIEDDEALMEADSSKTEEIYVIKKHVEIGDNYFIIEDNGEKREPMEGDIIEINDELWQWQCHSLEDDWCMIGAKEGDIIEIASRTSPGGKLWEWDYLDEVLRPKKAMAMGDE
jgi:hypothetical protein